MDCTFLSRGLMCRDTRLIYIPEVPFEGAIYLSVGLNDEFRLTVADLSSLSRLGILDLPSSVVANIYPTLQGRYRLYKTLYELYLHMTDMKYLSSLCLSKLSSRIVINHQWNHLINIVSDASTGISLNVLIFRNVRLPLLSGHWIDGFCCSKTLDKRGVKFNYCSLFNSPVTKQFSSGDEQPEHRKLAHEL